MRTWIIILLGFLGAALLAGAAFYVLYSLEAQGRPGWGLIFLLAIIAAGVGVVEGCTRDRKKNEGTNEGP